MVYFPQIDGLGPSDIVRWFAMQSLDEASAYLALPVLGAGLIECCEALLRHTNSSARAILGTPDYLHCVPASRSSIRSGPGPQSSNRAWKPFSKAAGPPNPDAAWPY